MAIEKVNGIENAELPEGVQVAVTETEITPGITELEDGSAIIGEMQEQLDAPISIPFDANLADYIEDGELGTIASDIVGDIENDIQSRKDWEEQYKSGLELLVMN